METKVFHSKKGKKDFKSKRLNKEEKTLFPYTFLGISLESTPQISDAVYKSIVDLSEAFSSVSSSDILSFSSQKTQRAIRIQFGKPHARFISQLYFTASTSIEKVRS